MKQVLATILIFVNILLLSACDSGNNAENSSESDIVLRPFDLKVGTKFTRLPANIFKAPTLEEVPIKLPAQINNADAIWGATGRDDEGNIYFGVSTHGIDKDIGNDSRTAYLYQYNPVTLESVLQSDVITELKRAGIYREGTGQNKLHSKIYQANDGYLYFSSFDEAGEDEGINPTWGGHLWRKKPHLLEWEHVLSTEEALIAVNTNGRYVYTLGYWNHVLYQFDTQTQKTTRIVVGSVSTHISRNFIVDENGQVFVPYLKENDYNELEVFLNHYDTNLRLIAAYPMTSYQHNKIKNHHGIIGYTSMESGDIYFTTAEGGLYQLKLTQGNEDKLLYKGLMYENTKSYTPSLFTFSGKGHILSLGKVKKQGMQWAIYDLYSSTEIHFPVKTKLWRNLNFYGTLTKDNAGAFYIAGNQKVKGRKGNQPLLIKMYMSH